MESLAELFCRKIAKWIWKIKSIKLVQTHNVRNCLSASLKILHYLFIVDSKRYFYHGFYVFSIWFYIEITIYGRENNEKIANIWIKNEKKNELKGKWTSVQENVYYLVFRHRWARSTEIPKWTNHKDVFIFTKSLTHKYILILFFYLIDEKLKKKNTKIQSLNWRYKQLLSRLKILLEFFFCIIFKAFTNRNLFCGIEKKNIYIF